MDKTMGWDVIKEPSLQLVKKHFSEKELKDINAFLKSPSGKAYADKSPMLSAELTKIISINIQKELAAQKN